MVKMISDRYEILDNLGEGGMADVYLAMDTILNRKVAVKILRGELSSDPIALVRFQREANAASKLNHPNVVDVYDVGEYQNKHYIVMEYVGGKTLKQLLSQRGALHKEEAVNIMKQLTSAVEHAHQNNIIHRDIKPQNVMVKDDGTVKMMDFGIALAHDAVQLTQSDAVLGSAHYLAPETTRGEPATNQIDIYALGIVFYELLTGSVPFKGDNPVQIAMRHLREEVPSVREFNPTLPQSIENIIIKATAKNRAFRYKTARQMLYDLNTCLLPENQNVEKVMLGADREPAKTVVMQPASMTGDHEDPRKKRNLIIGIGTAAAAVLLAVIIYFSGIIPGFSFDPMIAMPDIVNHSKEDAEKMLADAGFDISKISYKEELDDVIISGYVIGASVETGEKTRKSTALEIRVSKGVYYTIQDYTGKKLEDIKAQFEKDAVKIKVHTEYRMEKDTTPNLILEQSGLKEGDKIDPNEEAEIRFVVSASVKFAIPGDIIGMPLNEAKKKLNDIGAAVVLEPLSTSDLSAEELEAIEKGVVIRCNPEVGSEYEQADKAYITLYYY